MSLVIFGLELPLMLRTFFLCFCLRGSLGFPDCGNVAEMAAGEPYAQSPAKPIPIKIRWLSISGESPFDRAGEESLGLSDSARAKPPTVRSLVAETGRRSATVSGVQVSARQPRSGSVPRPSGTGVPSPKGGATPRGAVRVLARLARGGRRKKRGAQRPVALPAESPEEVPLEALLEALEP